MKRSAGLLLALATLLAACRPSGAAVEAVGSGTFPCPAFHACIAWLAIRPEPWSPPLGWTPGKGDARFIAQQDGKGTVTVSGLAGGGPDGLLPGDYVLLLVYGEVDDTRSSFREQTTNRQRAC